MRFVTVAIGLVLALSVTAWPVFETELETELENNEFALSDRVSRDALDALDSEPTFSGPAAPVTALDLSPDQTKPGVTSPSLEYQNAQIATANKTANKTTYEGPEKSRWYPFDLKRDSANHSCFEACIRQRWMSAHFNREDQKAFCKTGEPQAECRWYKYKARKCVRDNCNYDKVVLRDVRHAFERFCG